ncbi:MAG TPA: Y-family DNA polymerase [Flavisolibacter sp.]
MIALIDCNNFYVSCERLFNPAIARKPVIVLSNNDGCAISRSEEAKALGIRMGTPAFMIRELIRRHDVQVFSSNYALYGDISNRVMQVIRSFVPSTEVYSIDEIFGDLSALVYSEPATLASDIREAVLQYTGIPVSVGIAPTKTLAKMANRCAKKAGGTGIFCATSPGEISAMLSATAIGDVWGIGPEHRSFLQQHQVYTAADFAAAPPAWVRRHLHVVGERTQQELRGVRCIGCQEESPRKKNICTARSFGKLITGRREVQQAVATFAAACARKMRNEGTCARKLHVFIQTNPHRRQDAQYFHSVTRELPVATSNTSHLVKHAMTALEMIYRPGFNYHKTGVIAMDLVPETQVQLALFENAAVPKDRAVMLAVDSINEDFGAEVIRPGRQEFNKKWTLRQEHLSGRFTTRFDHLVKVKAS